MKNRKVLSGILNHCYQRTVNGNLLFYTIFYCLVFFTLFCTIIKKYEIRAVALTLMPDHIHDSLIVWRKKDLSSFIQELTCRFAFMNNKECNRKTPLFKHPFGSVPKRGDKAARTNIIYLGNNPVERRLCEKAEQYQWNFLGYAISPCPFSERLVLRNASWALRRAIKEVNGKHADNNYLSYSFLRRIYKNLEDKERLQLTDYIVSLYNVIDYSYGISLFGSYDNMIHAMHYSTGSEYDINEIFTGKNDIHYARVGAYLKQKLNLKDIHKLFFLSEEKRVDLFMDTLKEVAIPPEQLAKYLRIPLVREK